MGVKETDEILKNLNTVKDKPKGPQKDGLVLRQWKRKDKIKSQEKLSFMSLKICKRKEARKGISKGRER